MADDRWPEAARSSYASVVAVLTAWHVDWRRLRRRLTRAGYTTFTGDGTLRVSRDGRGVVRAVRTDAADLPERATRSARQLLGLPPRDGLTCSFEGPIGPSEEWATVVVVARAVAADVPLAVLDDLVDTAYLVHPDRGLIGPDEYEPLRHGTSSTSDVLRRLLGGE
jgi:hypothetical protein